ncbi:MAG: ABC transporter permease [Bdellovibrionaceae bacterium]|nr:ABC transporter permease [Pseudobdellovibrionaceae bacterium]
MEILWFVGALLLSSLRMSVPLVFAGLGGFFSERSGVINIALEGLLLIGAFFGATVAHLTGSPWLGLLSAVGAGILYAALYAFFVIRLKSDQIVTGTALNILAVGMIPFLSKKLFDSTGSTPALSLEERFTWEPVFLMFFGLIITHLWFTKTRSGLWLNFAGEHPKALESSGINPRKVRWMAVLSSGAITAIGGATLSLFLASSYSPLMSAGRGFMALAALISGGWRPLPMAGMCLFFGLMDAIQIRLQGVELAGVSIPVQFIQIIPYAITIMILSGFVGRSRAPGALGQPL